MSAAFDVQQRCNACGYTHTVSHTDAPTNCPECGGFLKIVGGEHH